MTLPSLRQAAARLEAALEALDSEDPQEPAYDPVRLGGVLIVTLVVIGALYWLLWTLLVYEGGLPLKLLALGEVLMTSKTMRDFGYEGGPYAQGAFEGWFGNAAALLLTLLAVAALKRLYSEAARRSAPGR